MALDGGVFYYGFSAFYLPLINEFGWSRTALSGAFSFSRLEAGIAGPFVGFIIDRFGPRVLMLIGFAMVGTGFIVFSQVNSLEMFYVVFVLLLSVGSSFGFMPPANAAVANWFIRKRGFALAVMMSGVGIGGIGVTILTFMITQQGWRTAALEVGILFFVLATPLILLIRHRPEPYGYLPDGDSLRPEESITASKADEENKKGKLAGGSIHPAPTKRPIEVNFSVKQALSTNAFWMISLVYTARTIITGGVGVHEIPALQNIGFSPEGAAGVLAAMTIISIPGRIGFGWLADRYDKRYILGVCLALQFLGLLAFAYATDLTMIIVFLLVYSPAYGGLVPLMSAIWGEYFGRKRFATLWGLAQVITMWGTIAGPLVGGYTYDITQSYQLAFQFFAAANLVGLVLLLFVRHPKALLAHEAAPNS